MQRYAELRERGLPIVLVNGYRTDVDAMFVSLNDFAAVELAMDHLMELGHRRIGLAVGPQRYVPSRRRIEAFRTIARTRLWPEASDDDLEEFIAHTVFTAQGGASASKELLDRGMTAVIHASDVMALGGLQAGHELGLRLPEQLSIIGADGVEIAEYSWPALTTIRSPLAEMAAAVAQALIAEINGVPAPRAEVLFRPELIVRGSTAPPPA